MKEKIVKSISTFVCMIAVTGTLAIPSLAFANSIRSEYAPAVKANIVLQTRKTVVDQAISYPPNIHPQVTMLHVIIPPGKETGWHRHPVPGYAYIISGTLLLITPHGRYIFHSGQGFAESVNMLHNGKNIGKDPLEMLVTFLGSGNMPLVIKQAMPHGHKL